MPRMRIHCCSSGWGWEIAKLFLNEDWEAVAAMHVPSSKGGAGGEAEWSQ